MTALAQNNGNDRAAPRLTEDSMVKDGLENGKYLSFMIKHEPYGMDILAIKEIIEYAHVTRVPRVPATIRGVINLRGNVVPVIDLAERIGLGTQPVSRRACIVVTEVRASDEVLDVGVVVDSVNAVLDIVREDVEPAPAFGSTIPVDYIQGMGRLGKEFIVLLEMKKILDMDELARLDLTQHAGVAGGR